MKYTLSETNNLVNSGMEYFVPEEILQIIDDISSQVGAPNYVKTPVFAKRPEKDKEKEKDRRLKSSKRKKHINSNDDWAKKPAFRATKIEKSVGIKKNADDIRFQLNKLTDKNFKDIFNEIVVILDNLEENIEDTNIGSVIFELASGNRFYSETYAKFYGELAVKYDCINDTLNDNCDVYIEMFNNIKHVDPNENYEQFCEMNKINERRRSLSAFLVNLMKSGVLTRETINGYLVTLLCKFDNLLNTENMKNEVSEICESICILYDEEYDYSNYTVKNAMSVSDYLGHLATSSTSNYKSFANKTKFKIMDLLNI